MNSVDKTEWEKHACKKFFFFETPYCTVVFINLDALIIENRDF